MNVARRIGYLCTKDTEAVMPIYICHCEVAFQSEKHRTQLMIFSHISIICEMGNCLRVTETFLIFVLLFVPPFAHLSYGQVFMYKYMYKQKRDLPAKLR